MVGHGRQSQIDRMYQTHQVYHVVPVDTSICLFGTHKRRYGTLHDINFHRSPFCLAYVIFPLLSLPILAVWLLSYVWVFFR